MQAGVSEAVLFLCLAAVGAARGMDPVPLGSGELVSGRTVLLSAAADTLRGTGLGLQFSQARNESFDAVFRQTSLYGGLGALMGIVLVVQITDF